VLERRPNQATIYQPPACFNNVMLFGSRQILTTGLTASLPVSKGVVRRQCGSDGLWERDDSGVVWRDKSQCEEEKEVASREV